MDAKMGGSSAHATRKAREGGTYLHLSDLSADECLRILHSVIDKLFPFIHVVLKPVPHTFRPGIAQVLLRRIAVLVLVLSRGGHGQGGRSGVCVSDSNKCEIAGKLDRCSGQKYHSLCRSAVGTACKKCRESTMPEPPWLKNSTKGDAKRVPCNQCMLEPIRPMSCSRRME